MKKIKFKILDRCYWCNKATRRTFATFFVIPSLYIYRNCMPILAHEQKSIGRPGLRYVYGITFNWLFFVLSVFRLEFVKVDKPDNDTDADNVQGPIVFHEEEC